MKDLVLISAQPDDLCFAWQIQTQLHNFRKYGYSGRSHVLVFLPHNRIHIGYHPIWKEIEEQFPEAHIYYYPDTEGICLKAIQSFNYSPLNRPWMLRKHFEQHPELKDKAIFYHDSDIVFTKWLDFSPFLKDEICYLSDTVSYIGAKYFDSKIKDVNPEMLESYKHLDILANSLKMFGLTREIAEKNQNNSGGAQYLLKNIDSKFWADVFDGCLYLKVYLQNINQRYFPGKNSIEKENNGFQSWCADMWSVLWNIWKRGGETRCPPELNFAWRDSISPLWEINYIYHDAGASSQIEYDSEGNVKSIHSLFQKELLAYRNNEKTPFEDDLTYVSQKYCSFNYVKEIQETKQFLSNNP